MLLTEDLISESNRSSLCVTDQLNTPPHFSPVFLNASRQLSLMKCITICFAVLLRAATNLMAATIHVPADQPTIQAGITAAVDGDTVLVADGVYTGTGNYNIDLTGKKILVKSASGPNQAFINMTGMVGSRRGFICISGENANTIIDGFTIERAAADSGAGVFCHVSAPIFRNCTFARCAADIGGGAYTRAAGAKFENCEFYRCTARLGGGLYFDSSITEVVQVVFDSCSVSSVSWLLGGAVFVGTGSDVRFTNSDFIRCYGKEQNVGAGCVGGAMYCDTLSVVLLEGCRFLRNEAGTALGGANLGGAIYLDVAVGTVRECVFDSNGYSIGIYPANHSNQSTRSSLEASTVPNAAASGGAIFAYRATLTIEGCVFSSNAVPPFFAPRNRGGAVYSYESQLNISGSSFIDNLARNGYSLFARGSTIKIDTAIIAFSRAIVDTEGAPVACDTFSNVSVSVTCTDIYGNPNGNWLELVDSLETLYNNFSLDPQFCGRSVGNFHLQEDSPCRPELSPCGSLVGALPVEPGCNSCCEGTTGNANLAGSVDLSDLSLLISYLTSTPQPLIPCPDEANVNASGTIDLSDLSALIAFITDGSYTLPWCP